MNKSIALSQGYVSDANNHVLLGVDTVGLYPRGGPGRPSVRLISNNTYTHGLFIFDATHMPTGCGTWPAYWLLGQHVRNPLLSTHAYFRQGLIGQVTEKLVSSERIDRMDYTVPVGG